MIDPLTILKLLPSIYEAAAQLKEIYGQVKANKKQSARLNERVQLIIRHIKSLEEKLKQKSKQGVSTIDSALLGQLEHLSHTLESCVELVYKFARTNWLQRLYKKSDYTQQFSELNSDLCTLSTDLQLGLSIKSVFDREADVQDQRADLSELLAGQEEILSAAGHLESSQQEIHDHLLHGLLKAEQQRKQAELDLMSRRRFQNEIRNALKDLQSPTSLTLSTSSTSSPSPSPTPTSPKNTVLQIDYSDLEYNLSEPVGSGGFGDVYRGRWISRDLEVAIKKLRVNTLSKTALAEFNTEVELLASVPRHDHVVGLFGICIDQPKQIYLMVLDWMEQGSLFEFLRKSTLPKATPLPIHRKLHLMLQCTKAVNHLHLLRRPITHGDIKSMNFLLNSHGEIKIGQTLDKVDRIRHGDFGLSRVRTESMTQSKLTQQSQSSGGSLQYQAPELLKGFDASTKQSDVYALTIVLWEILTCKIPYAGISPERIQAMIPAGKRLSIQIDPSLSDEMNGKLKSLIEQGWHQQPQLRPTAQQLLQAIKILIKMVTVAQQPPVAVIPVSTPTSTISSRGPPTTTRIQPPKSVTISSSSNIRTCSPASTTSSKPRSSSVSMITRSNTQVQMIARRFYTAAVFPVRLAIDPTVAAASWLRSWFPNQSATVQSKFEDFLLRFCRFLCVYLFSYCVYQFSSCVYHFLTLTPLAPFVPLLEYLVLLFCLLLHLSYCLSRFSIQNNKIIFLCNFVFYAIAIFLSFFKQKTCKAIIWSGFLILLHTCVLR